jgi:starch synthase
MFTIYCMCQEKVNVTILHATSHSGCGVRYFELNCPRTTACKRCHCRSTAESAGELFADINKALDERTIGHNPERLNLMKGGLVYANAVTTVSPTYANEARSGGAAGYLRALINEPQILKKFSGVLNGIDTSFWCPCTDPLIPAPFNSKAPGGKAVCKRFVQQGLGLKVDAKKPLVVCISRLVPQKGIHMIRGAVGHTVANGGQFVVLGSGHADGDFRQMAEHDFRDSESAKYAL